MAIREIKDFGSREKIPNLLGIFFVLLNIIYIINPIKNEYIKLINYITSVDPDAFVTIYAVNEMMYRPKVIK